MSEEHTEPGGDAWAPPPAPADPGRSPVETPPPPPTYGSSSKPVIEQWVAIAAGAVAVIGAFMPWVSISSVFVNLSKSGVDDGGDGLFTAGVGVVGALAAWQLGKWLWVTVLGGIVIAAIGFYDYSDVRDRVDEVNADADIPAIASVGAGLYLTIVAGVVMFAAGATLWSKRRDSTGPEPAGFEAGPGGLE